jgi:DNA-directed RNA polymerase subunit RPC12/RpoP
MNKKFLSKIPVMEADPSLIEIAKRLEYSNMRYIAVGRIVTENDKEILLLHFFKRRELIKENTKAEFRTFICDDYITQSFDCQAPKWKKGSFEYIIDAKFKNGQWSFWYNQIFLADEETVKSIRAVLGNENTPLGAIDYFQKSVKTARLGKKHKIILDRIDEKMKFIKELPADFEKWLHSSAYADKRYIFYKYASGRKSQSGYCDACGADVEISKPRHRREGVCPSCKSKVVYIVSGKAKGILDLVDVAVTQRIPNGFAVRYFAIQRFFKDSEPHYITRERYRDLYEGEKCDEYYYGNFLTTGKVRWCENKSGYGMRKCVLYDRNLKTTLKGTPWEYSAIKEYAVHKKTHKFSVWSYLSNYSRKKYIEYLVKLRLFSLTESCISGGFTHCINDKGRNLIEILGVKKRYIKLLQELDADEYALKIVQKFSKLDYPTTSEFISELIEKFDTHKAEDVADMMKYTSFQRMMNYLNKRVTAKDTLGDVFITWRDYIKNCVTLEYDMTSDFIVFPKRLKRSHDVVSRRAEAKQGKERAETLGEISKGMGGYFTDLQSRYGFESDDFTVISPKNLNEIVKEGHRLRHCGGRYAEDAGEKKTIILFLRKSSCIDIPFFTIEIKGGKLEQCRGIRNCAMTDDVKSFIEIYKKSVLQSKRKVGTRQ